MMKTLRYSLLVLLSVMGLSQAHADGTTFDFDNDYAKLFPTLKGVSSGSGGSAVHDGDFTEATTSTAIDGFTVTVSAAAEGASADNRIWSGAPRLRMYSGTLTISGKGIKKIEFTGHSTNFNISTKTGTLEGKTWTGEADEVVFEVAKNTQINKLVINGDGQATPDPEPAPTTTHVATVKELTALADKTKFTFDGQLLIVAQPTNKYTYVKDATGWSLLYGNNAAIADGVGRTIAAGWTGQVSLYNQLFEAAPDAVPTLTDAAAVTVEPDEVQLTDVTLEAANHYVVLRGVSYGSVSGSNFSITKDGVTVAGYNSYKIDIPEPVAGATYSIVGVISRYKDTPQFAPISFQQEGTTAIQGVRSEGRQAGAAYNLAGQRTNQSHRGLVIQDGRKVVK